jgi:hypothetical protein
LLDINGICVYLGVIFLSKERITWKPKGYFPVFMYGVDLGVIERDYMVVNISG